MTEPRASTLSDLALARVFLSKLAARARWAPVRNDEAVAHDVLVSVCDSGVRPSDIAVGDLEALGRVLRAAGTARVS